MADIFVLTAASAPVIPMWRLVIAVLPAVAVLLILNQWKLSAKTSLLAIGRMLIQLLLLGYVLTFVFDESAPLTAQVAMVLLIPAVMLVAASWISLRVVSERRSTLLKRVVLSVAVGGGLTLLTITQGVIQPDP